MNSANSIDEHEALRLLEEAQSIEFENAFGENAFNILTAIK